VTPPGVRAPVLGWAARYASLAINVDRLHRRQVGQPLIAYEGPRSWVEEWEKEPIPSCGELREWADELLTSIRELDLGGPVGDDYVIDEELVAALRTSVAALMTAVQGVGSTQDAVKRPLVVDIERVLRAGEPWF
jgi:hypothetical protein